MGWDVRQLGVWRNGSASDPRSDGWEFESLCPHFASCIDLLEVELYLEQPFCVFKPTLDSYSHHFFSDEVTLKFNRVLTTCKTTESVSTLPQGLPRKCVSAFWLLRRSSTRALALRRVASVANSAKETSRRACPTKNQTRFLYTQPGSNWRPSTC